MKKYTHRYIARIILEAQTPLFVGSGESSLIKDALVKKDIHGFPMIPGTSLAGVIRHSLEDFTDDKNEWKKFFGYQENKEGEGSMIKISSAYLIIENGKVAEGIEPQIKNLEKYRQLFDNLPVRQHVRIDHKGVAKDKSLFDNEVVYKGSRFLFEVELKADANAQNLWNKFLAALTNPLFRIGQGTRDGYGQLKVISCKQKIFNLENKQDFNAYLNYDISLNADNNVLTDCQLNDNSTELIHYKLKLKPDDFFIFGSGFGDDEVDEIPVTEQVVEYDNNGTITSTKEYTLIPASSIKGALRHRTAYHYNKLRNVYADQLNNDNSDKLIEFYTEIYNDAVYELFGAEQGAEDRDPHNELNLYEERKGRRGRIIINDLFLGDGVKNDKIFNHVAIDRFTGGAIDGALYSEKVSYFEDPNNTIELNIFVEKKNYDDNILKAFENALIDVCSGLLPLGGMTTKGHGMFTGKLFKNNEKIFDYDNQTK